MGAISEIPGRKTRKPAVLRSSILRKGFHDGIDALLSTWKIAVVLARLKAASRDSKEAEAQDMMYATGMIDHIHGRKSRRKR